MKYKYCPNCGSKLTVKDIGDEGEVAWCEKCKRPWFDTFSTCIIALVYNENDEIALLQQNYISCTYKNLVSGYMKPGENAEESAKREIQEELGISPLFTTLVDTWWFEKKDLLMIGFFVKVKKTDLHTSKEVDNAEWVSADNAINQVHPEGSVSHALVKRFLAFHKSKQTIIS